jgi:hypothetical protein
VAPSPSRATHRIIARGDVVAVVGLIFLCAALFGPHLLGLSTFVGTSDRLHIFLNIRELQVDALQTLGRVPAWSDAILLGTSIHGLHWMLLNPDPIGAIMALFPAREVFRVAGYITALQYTITAVAAYLFIRDVVRSPFPAAVGAMLYVCSMLPIHWISIHDPAFAMFTLQPIGLLILRRVGPGRLAYSFLTLTAVVVALVGFAFLQTVPYVLVFFGLYAAYRFATVRNWCPLVVLGAASIVGILTTAPRLGTTMEDFRELSRSSSIQNTCSCEVLRWLDEGIFGRYPQEAAELGNRFLNLHEGLQVYSSTFAAAGVIVMLLRPRGGPAVIAGIGFLVTLAFLALPATGGGRAALWLLAGTGALAAWGLARPLLGRRAGMPPSAFVNDPDMRFFILFTLLGLAIVLSDQLRYLVYLAFFRVDFTHARIAVTIVLPLSVLGAAFVHELFGGPADGMARAGRPHLLALVVGGALAVGTLLLLDPVARAVVEQWFSSATGLEANGSWVISTVGVGRIVVALAVFVVVLTINWLARHVDLKPSAGRLRISWRRTGGSWRRLVPAYMLGCLILGHAFGHTYFQLNGAHTWTYPVPFLENNAFSPPGDVMFPPEPAARQAVRDRLETDAYRSITVSAPDGYPTYQTPSERGYSSFVAAFWQLRLANGYLGLSRRIEALPWPAASKTLRGISFTDQRTLPWQLLAALNVKYAIVASPSLLFNVPVDPARRGADAGPDDLTILENPLPVTPRTFFAERVTPRTLPAPPAWAAVLESPTGVSVFVTKEHAVHVAWQAGDSDSTYQVYRRQVVPTPGTKDDLLGTTGRGATGLLDTVLVPGATYEYRLRACDSRGCSEPSQPVTAQVSVGSVVEPRQLAATPRSGTEVLVTWEPVDQAASVRVEIIASTGGIAAPPVEVPPGIRSSVVSGLRPLRDYVIRLRACTSAGCSPHTAPERVSMPSALTGADLDGVIPADPADESIVEGLEVPLVLASAAGAIDADFREPDRIRIAVEPATVERFLVVNELYHPSWHAYANGPGGRTELKVWPTNIVMRGILVPPGVTQIELRFEPFMQSWRALLLVLAGLTLGAGGWMALRRLDRWRPDRATGAS